MAPQDLAEAHSPLPQPPLPRSICLAPPSTLGTPVPRSSALLSPDWALAPCRSTQVRPLPCVGPPGPAGVQ